MKLKIKTIKKLNPEGFSHHLLAPIFVVLVVTGIGFYLLLEGHAQTIPFSNNVTTNTNSSQHNTITLYAIEDVVVEDGLGPAGCIININCSDSSNKNWNKVHQLRANVARVDCGPSGNGYGTGHTQCHGHHNRISYLKFNLKSLNFVPTSATLQLYVLPNGDCNTSEPPPYPYNPVFQRHTLHVVSDNSWSESVITWNNRPAVNPAVIGKSEVDKIFKGTYFQIPFSDLTAIHTGVMSFAIENSELCHQTFAPHEIPGEAPQLIISS